MNTRSAAAMSYKQPKGIETSNGGKHVLRGDMLWKLEINSFRGLEIGTLSQSRLFAAAFRKPSEC